jgi:regulator of ribonuclease activity A
MPVAFGDVRFGPGEYVYCDEDGVVVAAERLDP